VLEFDGDGGFAGGGEAGEPDCEALLAAELVALCAGDLGWVVGDVSGRVVLVSCLVLLCSYINSFFGLLVLLGCVFFLYLS
jgi:hypothetical protein